MQHGSRRYALRIHSRDYHEEAAIASELEWLAAIARDTDLPVPSPVAPATTIELPHLGPRTCTLLRWVEGPRASRIGVASFRAIGELLARLHAHAAAFSGSRSFTRARWDAGAFGRHWFRPYDERGWIGLRPAVRALFRSVLARTAEAEARLTETFGLIHADLHRGNLVRTSRGLAPIDFDDCGYGSILYDLAVPLTSVYAAARSAHGRALVEGYRRVRPLPDAWLDDLDVFVAARAVVVALFVAGWARSDPRTRSSVAPVRRRVERFLRDLGRG